MKKKIIYSVIIAIVAIVGLSGCMGGPYTRHGGMSDRSYLVIASSDNRYVGENVQVFVDNRRLFDAKVVKTKKASYKGRKYAISTGKKDITVMYRNQVLVKKKIF